MLPLYKESSANSHVRPLFGPPGVCVCHATENYGSEYYNLSSYKNVMGEELNQQSAPILLSETSGVV